jgi:hypothetical protein
MKTLRAQVAGAAAEARGVLAGVAAAEPTLGQWIDQDTRYGEAACAPGDQRIDVLLDKRLARAVAAAVCRWHTALVDPAVTVVVGFIAAHLGHRLYIGDTSKRAAHTKNSAVRARARKSREASGAGGGELFVDLTVAVVVEAVAELLGAGHAGAGAAG